MSDTTSKPAAEQDADKGGQSGTYTPPASQADLDRIVSERIARERAKFADYDDLKAKASRFAEIEEASKTAEQKAAERLAELEAKVKGYETEKQVAAWKAEVAAAAGVPAVALAGSTKEELEAHAETLKSLITPTDASKGRVGPYVPPEGSTPSGSLGSTTGDMFAEAVESALNN